MAKTQLTYNNNTGNWELTETDNTLQTYTNTLTTANKALAGDIKLSIKMSNCGSKTLAGTDTTSNVTITTTGASSTSWYSVKASGSMKLSIASAGYIEAGDYTISFPSFKVGEIKKSTGMESAYSASGSLKTTVTPGNDLRYINLPYGYIESAQYVKIAKVNGYYNNGRTNGQSSGYTMMLSKDEIAIVCNDDCTLYYGNTSSPTTKLSSNVHGGAVIYWDHSNSAWYVCDYDDSPKQSLGTNATIYLRVNSGKYLRKMYVRFATS